MIQITLKVHQGRALCQYSVGMAFRDGVCHLFHISMPLSRIHIVPNANYFGKEGDHIGSLPHGLAMSDLGLHFIQLGQSQTQAIHRGGKAETGAGAVVSEYRDSQAIVEDLPGLFFFVQLLQNLSNQHHGFQVVHAVFPGEQKVFAKKICF